MFFFTCLRSPCVSHSGQWLPVSGCLSSLVSLCLSPSLALDVWWCPAVRMSFLCIHLFPIMFLLPSFSGFKYLSPNSSVFNHQSAWWWLILLPVCLCACLPSFVSDHVSPTSWVFPFICSPSGSVLFLFQHVFVCD